MLFRSVASRHYQSGPRPEEYTYLRALIYANAVPRLEHVAYLVALLPYTEGEKPRFEDRTKTDSQRVWLGRILLERAGLRSKAVEIARAILNGSADQTDALYLQLLAGTNIDRPRSEHGRAFPIMKQLEPEQALHFLYGHGANGKSVFGSNMWQTGEIKVATVKVPSDRKSTRLNSSHRSLSRMPSSA